MGRSKKTVSQTRMWVAFVLLRVAFFAAPFALIFPLALSANIDAFISAVIAASLASLIGLSLSFLFLGRARSDLAARLARLRASAPKPGDSDEVFEDDILERGGR